MSFNPKIQLWFLSSTRFLRYSREKNTTGIRVTDLGRTVIVSIRDYSKIGGFEEGYPLPIQWKSCRTLAVAPQCMRALNAALKRKQAYESI
jgi:hypothetical protein